MTDLRRLIAQARTELSFAHTRYRRSRDPKVRRIRRRVAGGMDGALPGPRRRRSGAVWAITVVKDEIDVVEDSIRHMIRQGVEHVLVADNMSTDGTFDLVTQLANELPITVVRDREPAFFQGAKLSYLARTAWRGGADWVVPFDADEFWFAPGQSLVSHLQSCSETVIEAKIYNGYPTGTGGWRLDLAGHPIRHVLFRSHPFVEVSEGFHWVKRPGLKGGGLFILHLPWRSRQQMHAKVLKGAQAMSETLFGGDVDGHWIEMARAVEGEVDEMWGSVRDLAPTDLEFGYKPVGPYRAIDFRRWTAWPMDLT